MEIKLAYITTAKNVVNKNAEFSETLIVRPRGQLDSINPVLILRGHNYAEDFNYAEFVDNNNKSRFYHISEVENIGGDLYRVTFELDVLETFKDVVLNSTAKYRRALKNGDYVASGFDEATTKTIRQIDSDKELPPGETMILTTVGSK